jgi:hypothetical protein
VISIAFDIVRRWSIAGNPGEVYFFAGINQLSQRR